MPQPAYSVDMLSDQSSAESAIPPPPLRSQKRSAPIAKISTSKILLQSGSDANHQTRTVRIAAKVQKYRALEMDFCLCKKKLYRKLEISANGAALASECGHRDKEVEKKRL